MHAGDARAKKWAAVRRGGTLIPTTTQLLLLLSHTQLSHHNRSTLSFLQIEDGTTSKNFSGRFGGISGYLALAAN